MSQDSSASKDNTNLSGLGRALLGTNEGSKPASGPWVPPTAEELGKMLPDYEIVKMLGRGGMGAVYMGRQKSLDRAVAIKILSGALEDSDLGFAERFKNEARAMAKLNHPGIVAVYDFGETAGGLLYIVMEYVDGTDVARMVAKEGRLHTDHAMAITAHVCDALEYAHTRGIIHRDIKPANIMVGYDGVVKVADFGLAKMTHANATGLTQSGMAMGTLHYMAPEALMLGSAVDHRADIYAVGVMLYQMLTGKIPQGMFKLPSLQIGGLDPRYDGIISKAIMEDREARYPAIREMRHDLDGILTQPVVKVEAEVSQAPAALPTMARPQRPEGRPYRPPQPAVIVRTEKKSSQMLWTALIVCAGLATWLFLKKDEAMKTPDGPVSAAAGGALDPAKASVPGSPAPVSAPASEINLAATTKDQPTTPATTTIPAKTASSPVAIVSPPSQADTAAMELLVDVDFAKLHEGFPAVATARIIAGWTEGRYQLTALSSAIWVPSQPAIQNLALTDFVCEVEAQIPRQAAGNWAIRLANKNHRQGDYIQDFRFEANGTAMITTPTNRQGSRLDTPALPAGAGWNKMRVEAANARYRLFVNDRFVTEVPQEGRLSPNGIAIPLNTPAPGLEVWIRRVRVWQPRSAPAPALPTGPTAWTDTKGRSITATFKAVASGNVLLDIAGKVQPVPLNTLSAASQKLARDHDEALGTGAPKTAAQPSQIPADAFSHGTSRYAYFAGAMNWQEARARAESLGGHLVTFNTQAEEAAVEEQVRARFGTGIINFWIGGILDTLAGSWRWITGEAFTYTHWGPKEPNNANAAGERSSPPFVVACHLARNSYVGWHDYSISQTNWQSIMTGYLVEWDHVPATSQPAPAASSAASSSLGNPANATKDKPFVNSLGMKFVPVPGTKVLFCIHETRRQDYAAFAGQRPDLGTQWMTAKGEDSHAVVNVNWDDARAFCAWLTLKDGVKHRLPTDREWSTAAGIGHLEKEGPNPKSLSELNHVHYPWGTSWPPPNHFGNYMEGGINRHLPATATGPYTDGHNGVSAPVMSYRPNNLGIHDLGGNVWEWCEDWYDETQTTRVLRGNSWWGGREPHTLLSAYRFKAKPDEKNLQFHDKGFRVAIELP